MTDSGMYCTQCGTHNPAAARFCKSCGTILAEVAPVARVRAAPTPPRHAPELPQAPPVRIARGEAAPAEAAHHGATSAAPAPARAASDRPRIPMARAAVASATPRAESPAEIAVQSGVDYGAASAALYPGGDGFAANVSYQGARGNPPGPTWLAALAGAGAVAGGLLPWASVTVQYSDYSSTTVSVNGTDTRVLDGWYAMVLGCVLALMVLVNLAQRRDAGPAQGVGELILAALLGCLAIKDIVPLNNASSALSSSWFGQYGSLSVGPGLWLVAAASALAALGGLWRMSAEPSAATAGGARYPLTGPATLAGAVGQAAVQRRQAVDHLLHIGTLGIAANAITFVDVHHGWAVGANGAIVRSADGGATWTVRQSGTINRLNGVAFADALQGWAAGTNGTVLHTKDGGATWTTRRVPTSETLHAITCLDAATAWAVGEGGTIIRTRDGGVTWVTQPAGTAPLYGVAFRNTRSGCAVGDDGVILRTNDGGASWARAPAVTRFPLWEVAFNAAGTGWAVSNRGVIVHTADGGLTWFIQRKGMYPLHGIACAGDRVAWAVGANGLVLHTADGGATWNVQQTSTNRELLCITAINTTHAWVAGAGGLLLHTADGGTTWR